MSDKIVGVVSEYYTQKVKEHGATPRGVDWNSKESQFLRFEKLMEVMNVEEPFTVLDYGCGTAAMASFFKQSGLTFQYSGYDISEKMLEAARNEFPAGKYSSLPFSNKFDYVIGSGIFNVRFQFNDDEWKKYILDTLQKFNELSVKGFAFNVLSIYSDVEKRRPDLFYADPLFLFDHCKKNFSRNVSLLHDYNLYEFTIIVRKME